MANHTTGVAITKQTAFPLEILIKLRNKTSSYPRARNHKTGGERSGSQKDHVPSSTRGFRIPVFTHHSPLYVVRYHKT